jgi:hypothetical protein
MKKCPNCEKTFDDAMKFCQVDGTPLVDDVPEVDPYKTMVAGKAEIAAAMASLPSEPQPEEDVLQIPSVEHDPKKTMYASEDEIRSAMAEVDQPVMDIPPVGEPAPPAFIDSGLSGKEDREDPGFSKTTPPIPSPFGGPKADNFEPSPPAFSPPDPEPPNFARAEPPSPTFNPFNEPAPEVNAPLAQADWTPPPAAQDNSRHEEKMQNPQYQPGSNVSAAGQNKILPIVSLVFGILSLCCYFAPLTGLVALITGFLGMKNANNDPANYGGKGLAIAGMVIGGLFFVVGLAYYVFLFFFGGMAMMMDMMNQPR